MSLWELPHQCPKSNMIDLIGLCVSVKDVKFII